MKTNFYLIRGTHGNQGHYILVNSTGRLVLVNNKVYLPYAGSRGALKAPIEGTLDIYSILEKLFPCRIDVNFRNPEEDDFANDSGCVDLLAFGKLETVYEVTVK